MNFELCEIDENAVLCFIRGNTAYFTTQPLEEAWGDDWNDAPYECNAGTPYRPSEKEQWKIFEVVFFSELETPSDHTSNSCVSVQMINSGDVPWLKSPSWRQKFGNSEKIYAGTTLKDFADKIFAVKGLIFLPAERPTSSLS